MRFLVDAQLPRRLAIFLNDKGHDSKHTLDLPQANRTPDQYIATLADQEGRVVVTKDNDFLIGHLLDGSPQALLIVVTGNITNKELLGLIGDHLDDIVRLLGDSAVVELGRDRLIAHADRDPGT
ncbi:putative nuclease of putative toxin-antitoxin system [Nocardia kruczakiae]|uniref:Nuclease of putative toxin-antitoxin system n=1 Tax=Nocardia kruczakiae TaxID=261477 RepID=A0ABU1XL97_9NOCA|nr:DUF5615 family PIN-like protein [Nocardia kruczakiae]MDR7170786.1 putative nuclease of putative toxin-antitoxin system [Nocardia kruczakiae]